MTLDIWIMTNMLVEVCNMYGNILAQVCNNVWQIGNIEARLILKSCLLFKSSCMAHTGLKDLIKR